MVLIRLPPCDDCAANRTLEPLAILDRRVEGGAHVGQCFDVLLDSRRPEYRVVGELEGLLAEDVERETSAGVV